MGLDTNNSPWLHQLDRKRPPSLLERNHEVDIAIIGGGIAGVATAFFCLKNTDKKVALLESSRIAHGATGHNGGFLAGYFERPFFSIAQEFGLKKAVDAQKALDSAWDLLDEIREEAKISTPMWQFVGFAGCASVDELVVHLRNFSLQKEAGLEVPKILVSESAPELKDIPKQYKDLYALVPQDEILDKLETDRKEYFAVLPERKGCMNSAAFTEEVINYLLEKYKDRFILGEHARVRRLVLKDGYAVMNVDKDKMIAAKHVVLCTNGFETVKIVNVAGRPVDSKFHHMIRGIIGYMAGYTESQDKPPTEINYLPTVTKKAKDVFEEEPYFYITRRPFEAKDGTLDNLICIGGPEALLEDTRSYNRQDLYSNEARRDIDDFLKHTYRHGPKDKIEYKFLWHGLMGFTPNGIRLIGREPRNPILMYNLGCNGVGLLPSIYGGKKISDIVAGKKQPPSIFDPQDSYN